MVLNLLVVVTPPPPSPLHTENDECEFKVVVYPLKLLLCWLVCKMKLSMRLFNVAVV